MSDSPVDLFRVTMSPEAGPSVARLFEPDQLGRIYVGQGTQVDLFERAFAALTGLGQPFPLGVNSCTAAIDMALHLIGLQPGDEVIATPITCTATNGQVVTRGAKLVWADVDPVTGNIDPKSVARLITRNTRAVIAVDWGGRSCDYNEIRARVGVVCAAYGLSRIPIIQDAAHRLYIDPVNRGDYVAWSFGPIKHLTCGGYGGALLPPPEEHERAKLLRWHGLDRESKADFRCAQDIVEVGYRYHLTDDQATVGLTNLALAPWAVAQARGHAAFYDRYLGDAEGIMLPPFDPKSDYWFYTLLAHDRDGLSAYLAQLGIASSQVHARNDKHTAFKAATAHQDQTLSGVRRFDAHQLAIPVGWWVTDQDMLRIVHAIRMYQPAPELATA